MYIYLFNSYVHILINFQLKKEFCEPLEINCKGNFFSVSLIFEQNIS